MLRERMGGVGGAALAPPHSHGYARLPVRPGSVVEGGGAGRTGELAGGHIVSGWTGHIVIGHHWGAHWLQSPVGGVLPVHAE